MNSRRIPAREKRDRSSDGFFLPWLTPFKFVGMALLFPGIGLAVATIVRVLRWQANRLWEAMS